MTVFFSLCVLAFAVSVDSFGAGLAYGLRGLKLPFYSLLCISLCSAFSVLTGGMMAALMTRYLPDAVTEVMGGVILIGIGIWAVIQVLKDDTNQNQSVRQGEKKTTSEPKGIWKQLVFIVKKPDEADIDHSGTINTKEAVFLGAALSLDAFGAGTASALLGLSPIILAVTVGLMCALFLSVGMKGGRKLAGTPMVQKFSFLPGVVLICLGVWNLH
ncbi:sporulation membrane protein YtaF [Salibacterium salarium]|uniref:Sporulation membrane protein YtaF n=1 Tax=Salibacterium salarium TaxID=284579 RepID=A0A3R9RFK0_9BACI|nr:sporulation membrane protein YtaF [Salibacterium salarium]RSL34301.1 sporulation membrane protein YtaF [Salibacterium salarium]